MKKLYLAAATALCAAALSPLFSGCVGEATVQYEKSDDGTYCIVKGVSGDERALKSYNVPATYEIDGAVLPVKEIGPSAFYLCRNLKEVTLPDSVTVIENLAFAYCGFESFTIPDSVKEIGWSAFAGCDSLKEITVPESVEKLGNRAFCNCDRLEKAIIKANIEHIDYSTFQTTLVNASGNVYSQSAITTVYLPRSLKRIHKSAFYGGVHLKDVYYEGTQEEWAEVIFYEMKPNTSTGEPQQSILEGDKRGFYVTEKVINPEVTVHYNYSK